MACTLLLYSSSVAGMVSNMALTASDLIEDWYENHENKLFLFKNCDKIHH